MKPLKIFFTLAFFMTLFSCDDVIVPEDVQSDLLFLKTVEGGCNNQNFSTIKSLEPEKDTVIVSQINDTLNIFTGINYICCAPFVTETFGIGDSIFVKIIDTCEIPAQNCYCKCNCYYTWDFQFTGLNADRFYLKIELFDPRLNKQLLISEGIVNL